jgi:hypothetical protein
MPFVAPRGVRRQYTRMRLTAYVLAPLAVTALATALVIAALHGPLRHTMRARGLADWRLRDTLLTTPLFLTGVTLALLAATHGIVRLAVDAHTHADGLAHVLGTVGAVAGGVVMAAFGLRAVGKLF